MEIIKDFALKQDDSILMNTKNDIELQNLGERVHKLQKLNFSNETVIKQLKSEYLRLTSFKVKLKTKIPMNSGEELIQTESTPRNQRLLSKDMMPTPQTVQYRELPMNQQYLGFGQRKNQSLMQIALQMADLSESQNRKSLSPDVRKSSQFDFNKRRRYASIDD